MDIFEGRDLLITVWRWGRPSTVWPEGPRSVELRVGEAEGKRVRGAGSGSGVREQDGLMQVRMQVRDSGRARRASACSAQAWSGRNPTQTPFGARGIC